jgi:hypothetical protein
VALLGTSALAFVPRHHHAGTCMRDVRTLPRDGAVDVPLNARVWRLFRGMQVMNEPLPGLQPFTTHDLRDLQPFFTGDLPMHHVHFTTGDAVDREPPAQPSIGGMWISVGSAPPGQRADVESVRISGTFSPDTALLRLRVHDAVGTVTYVVPFAQSLDGPGFWIAAGPVDIEIVAIDLAGNESPPTRADPIVDIDPAYTCPPEPPPTTTVEPPPGASRVHGNSAVVFVPLALDLLLFVAFAIAANRAARARAAAYAVPISLAAVEQIARRVRLRGTVTFVAMAIAFGGVAPLGSDADVVLGILSPVLFAVGLAAFAAWLNARRVLRFVTRAGAIASLRHDQIVVAADSARALLVARPSVIRRLELPHASVDLK